MARRRSGERESEQDGEGESAWGHRAFLGAARRLVQVRRVCQGKISEAVINVAGADGHAGSRWATPTVGRKAAASGAPEVVELPTNASDSAGSRTEGLAGCERRGHDHENTARGAGRSGPRAQRPIPYHAAHSPHAAARQAGGNVVAAGPPRL